MRQRFFQFSQLVSLILVLTLSACFPQVLEPRNPTRAPGDVRSAAGAQAVADQFLTGWQAENYAAMYDLLSTLSRDAISLEKFEATYRDAAEKLTLETLSFQLLSTMAEESHAEVAFRVDFDTMHVGALRREIVMRLILERNTWWVQWERALILPELTDGNYLTFVYDIPSRGRILDREGAPLAAYEDAIAVGIVPRDLLPEQSEEMFRVLAEISAYDTGTLERLVESTPVDWYLPLVTLSKEDLAPHIETLRNLSGVRMNEYRSRIYVEGGVAPHVVGYMTYIPEESLESYLRLGYRKDERIGAFGLEAVYEAELSGQRGGSLYLVDASGEIQSLLAASEAVPGQSLYTTLDKELQKRLQASLGDLRAAAVVIEVDTGRILALASNPAFDPNAFDLADKDQGIVASYFSDEDQPLFNRATQGQYPLGSVFKSITMSTALEKGIFRPSSSFYCGHRAWVCDSVWLDDWTLGHGVAASGDLTLTEGLMRSCNPWFYRIGESLFVEGLEDALSEMAVSFGLGAMTGVEILEAAGNIPQTAGTCVNNAQIAIGQGEVLVTPLQVAAFYAAIANGGTLYRPALISSIKPASGELTYEFDPEVIRKLPISEATLTALQQGLQMVVEDPRGTGYWAMGGLEVPVSGKTGTAQTPSGAPHAWFAGYSRLNDPERPDIAVAVIVENGGEGSVMAAPVFRRVVSLYFSNYEDPGGLMPWEVEPYVIEKPTPTPTTTPPSDE